MFGVINIHFTKPPFRAILPFAASNQYCGRKILSEGSSSSRQNRQHGQVPGSAGNQFIRVTSKTLAEHGE